jgi:hypothetical protein
MIFVCNEVVAQTTAGSLKAAVDSNYLGWAEVVKLLLAPTGIFGLWAKYTLDRKDRVKTDREATSKIIEKIELNDAAQNKKIELIEEKMTSLLESEKASLAIKKLKITLEQTTSGILDGVEENNIKETVSYGVSNAIDILNGVIIQDFNIEPEVLILHLKVGINKVVNFNPSSNILEGDGLSIFKQDLQSKLRILSETFVIEARPVFKLRNGERRKAFMELANNYIRKTIIESIELYKYHKHLINK